MNSTRCPSCGRYSPAHWPECATLLPPESPISQLAVLMRDRPTEATPAVERAAWLRRRGEVQDLIAEQAEDRELADRCRRAAADARAEADALEVLA